MKPIKEEIIGDKKVVVLSFKSVRVRWIFKKDDIVSSLEIQQKDMLDIENIQECAVDGSDCKDAIRIINRRNNKIYVTYDVDADDVMKNRIGGISYYVKTYSQNSIIPYKDRLYGAELIDSDTLNVGDQFNIKLNYSPEISDDRKFCIFSLKDHKMVLNENDELNDSQFGGSGWELFPYVVATKTMAFWIEPLAV